MDVLHEHGFTGKGAVIAYVDMPFAQHEQFADANVHYVDNSGTEPEPHGTTVLSMLVGKDIGTAPEAEVYFYAQRFDREGDQICLGGNDRYEGMCYKCYRALVDDKLGIKR